MTHSYDHFNDLPMESNLRGNTTTTCMYAYTKFNMERQLNE